MLELNIVTRLSKDLKKKAITLQVHEIKQLVDSYYIYQEYRKSTGNQELALENAEKQHEVISYFNDQIGTLENQIKSILDEYTSSNDLGRWLKSIVGIGPVISAGLIAYIDIHKAPTAGHIWRYAGLDPTVEWIGRTGAVQYMEKFTKEGLSFEEMIQKYSKILGYNADLLREKATPMSDKVTKVSLIKALTKHLNEKESFEEHIKTFKKEGTGYEDMVELFAGMFNIDLEVLKKDAAVGVGKITKESLIKAASIRPWNAKLKVICWKIGQSFMKFSGKDDCVYGKLYLQRKQYENDRNNRMENKEHATKLIAKYGKSTQAYKHLLGGKLPPAQIDARARRWVVKIFLSHLQEFWYKLEFKKDPPAPFAIAILGHAHKIEMQ